MSLGIKRQLLRAGIAEEDIPRHWLEAIIAATEKWLVTTEDGLEHFRRLFCFKAKRGEDDKEYTLVDNISGRTITVDKSDVWTFEGALVGGRPVPLVDIHKRPPVPALELEITENRKTKCDGCGIFAHCIQEVLEPFDERMKSYCNFCISMHEHAKVSDFGGLKNCELCTVHNCKHHPERLRA